MANGQFPGLQLEDLESMPTLPALGQAMENTLPDQPSRAERQATAGRKSPIISGFLRFNTF